MIKTSNIKNLFRVHLFYMNGFDHLNLEIDYYLIFEICILEFLSIATKRLLLYFSCIIVEKRIKIFS